MGKDLKMVISQEEWQDICNRPMQITRYTKLQWLQFRILNSILGTNSLLNKMKLLDSNHCSFCNLEQETISHLMYNCDTVKCFWKQCQSFLERNTRPMICNISHQMVILGFPSNDALNIILLLAKFHIYKSKMIKKRPVFSAFEYEFLMYLKAERISAVSNNKLKLFNIKWKDWKKYISINIK